MRSRPLFVKSMFNAAVRCADKPNRDWRSTRYTSKNRSLKSYMQKGDSRVKCASRQAVSDVHTEIIGAITALDIVGNGELYVPVTGGRIF